MGGQVMTGVKQTQHRPHHIRTSSALLRDLFGTLNKTKEEAAASLAGVDKATVWGWRVGRSSPRFVDLEAFVEACGYRLELVKKD